MEAGCTAHLAPGICGGTGLHVHMEWEPGPLPGRSQVPWAQGQGRRAARASAGSQQRPLGNSLCSPHFKARQPTQQRCPVVSCRERWWSTWMTSWSWRRPASPQESRTLPFSVQGTQILCLPFPSAHVGVTSKPSLCSME